MTDYLVKGENLTSVADALREKTNTTSPLTFPDGFVKSIQEAGSFATGSGSPASSQTAPIYIDTDIMDTSNPQAEAVYIRID